jgi:hypothetical protein
MKRKISIRLAAATTAATIGVILLLAGIRAGMMAGERV